MTLDHRQFETIYLQYYHRLVVVARRYVRDADVAHDLVMDSFTSFWLKHKSLDDDINIGAYIVTTVKNRCLDWLEAQQLHLLKHQDLHSLQMRLNVENLRALKACEPSRLFASEVSAIVERELSAMPDLTRKVFSAARFENKTYAEIASELGITQRRVATEIQRALSLLRVALKDYLPMIIVTWLLNIK